MKPLPDKPAPEQDDFLLFRRIVRRAPPWFLSILIILALGALLSRVVFNTYPAKRTRDVAVDLRGAFLGGDEGTGEDQDEGASGEEEETAEDLETPQEAEAPMEAPLEPSRWLESEPAPAPIGPEAKAQPRPSDPGAGVNRASSGGAGGRGARGDGPGSGSPWGSREGTGRGRGVRRYGGNRASESAVEKGLEWLHRHQAANGAWRADGFETQCSATPCGGEALKGVNYDGGVTALSLMAFLGAGYTHREGRYTKTVQRGLDFLLAVQKADGRFGSETLYSQAMAVIALSEALGMTGDVTLRGPLERGVRFLVRSQQPRGGWTYDPAPKKQRNDTSIAAFAVMGLKSAREAGIAVPESAFDGARRHVLRATQENGDVWYADAAPGWDRRGAGMIASGLFMSLLLGRSPDHPMVGRQIERLQRKRPVWGEKRDLDQSYVTWYYENLVFFALGGEAWARWNPRFRDMLIAQQRREGCADGSWDPEDLWSNTSGRIYSTAIHVLNLEIYYKYSPLFLVPSESEWEEPAGAEPDTLEGPGERGAEEEESGRKAGSPDLDEDELERWRRLRELIGDRKK